MSWRGSGFGAWYDDVINTGLPAATNLIATIKGQSPAQLAVQQQAIALQMQQQQQSEIMWLIGGAIVVMMLMRRK
jgi:hypothetical protein